MTATNPNPRRSLITKIHIARTQLGMDDESYRANLAHYGNGKTSSTDMTIPELETVLEAFKKLGFKPVKKPGKGRLSPSSKQGPQDERSAIRAIWIFMFKAGFVQDGSETALNSWVQRMTAKHNGGLGIAEVQWLTGDAPWVLNAIKRWARRCIFEDLKKRGYEPHPQDTYNHLLKRWERINGAML